MKSRFSFSARLSLYVILITAVLFIFAMHIVGDYSRRIITDDAKQNATNMLDATIGDIEKILSNVEAAVENSVWLVQEHKDDPEFMYKITKALVQDNKNIVGSAVAFETFHFPDKGEYYAPYTCYNKDSTLTSFQLGNIDNDYPNQEWYLLPELTKKAMWSEPYFDEGGGKITMTTYSVPILDEAGNVYAVITADISLQNLTDIINNTKPYERSYTMLVSRNGSFVSHPDSAFVMAETLYSVMKEYAIGGDSIVANVMEGKSGIGEFTSEGEKAVCVYGPISNGWSAIITYQYDDVLKGVYQMNLIVQIVLAIGLILLFFCCMFAIKKISKPITQFSDYAIEIAKGNLNAQLPEVTSTDEISDLHDSLGTMQTSLKKLKATTAAKERFESELNIARNIQFGMVPKNFPDFLHAILIPAKEVGGDLYDFAVRNDTVYFAIGDVSGKGVPAALIMAITRNAFGLISGLNLPVNEVMRRINNSIHENNDLDMFVTLFLGKLDLKTGHLQYCNAGHNPIVIVSPDGTSRYLKAKANLAVGLIQDFPYVGEEIEIEPESRFILYTDGVTEAETQSKDQYGEDRLIEFANQTSKINDVKTVTENLLASVRQFTDGAEQNDDITIMIIDYGKKI